MTAARDTTGTAITLAGHMVTVGDIGVAIMADTIMAAVDTVAVTRAAE